MIDNLSFEDTYIITYEYKKIMFNLCEIMLF